MMKRPMSTFLFRRSTAPFKQRFNFMLIHRQVQVNFALFIIIYLYMDCIIYMDYFYYERLHPLEQN